MMKKDLTNLKVGSLYKVVHTNHFMDELALFSTSDCCGVFIVINCIDEPFLVVNHIESESIGIVYQILFKEQTGYINVSKGERKYITKL
jgi:hypothetical protein